MKLLKKFKSFKQPKFALISGSTYIMKLDTYQKHFKKFPFHFFSTFLYYDIEFAVIKQQCPIKKTSNNEFEIYVLNGIPLKLNSPLSDTSVHYAEKYHNQLKEKFNKIFKTDTLTPDFNYCDLCKNKIACTFFSNEEIKKSKKTFIPITKDNSFAETLLNLNFTEDNQLKELFYYCQCNS
jgi:hypothetical protein